MKVLDPAFATHVADGVTTLCRCWRIARKDGTVMGFTDHDRDLSLDGTTYRAATGFTATAIEDQLGLAVSNLDVEGALSSAAITEADLHAGRYDDASVTILLVNWQDVDQRVVLRSGFLGQTTRGRLGFTAELRGLASRLDQSAGRLYQRSCGWELGDARCQVDLDALGFLGLGTVASVISAFEFTATGLSLSADGTFTRGRLTWISGANDGLAVEIKSHSQVGAISRITLFLPMPDTIAVGDMFDVTARCDKALATCRDRFGNVANFGGFPHMPGNDFVLSYPTRGDEAPTFNGLTLYRPGIVTANVDSDTSASGYGARVASNDSAGGQNSLAKARGSIAAPLAVLQNDFLGQFNWSAYDGSAWRSCVSMFARVLAATPGPGDVFSQWQLWVTPSGSGTRQQTLTFDLTNGLQYVSSIVIDANRHFRPRSYTIATLPTPVAAGEVIQCSDLGGGAGTLESTGAGSAWRRRTAGQQTVATDAAFTLTPLTSAEEQKHTGTLTAHRAVTLSLTRAHPGARFRIARTGGGAFNLDVGPGPLKSLATNTWAEFVCDGSAWFLAAYGVL